MKDSPRKMLLIGALWSAGALSYAPSATSADIEWVDYQNGCGGKAVVGSPARASRRHFPVAVAASRIRRARSSCVRASASRPTARRSTAYSAAFSATNGFS